MAAIDDYDVITIDVKPQLVDDHEGDVFFFDPGVMETMKDNFEAQEIDFRYTDYGFVLISVYDEEEEYVINVYCKYDQDRDKYQLVIKGRKNPPRVTLKKVEKLIKSSFIYELGEGVNHNYRQNGGRKQRRTKKRTTRRRRRTTRHGKKK
jgi:hypothetical protein